MAKPTLLEIVQEILSDMDSDDVNSIDDTEEAGQVAKIVKSTFESMLSSKNWPHAKRIIHLTPSGDNNLPTHMSIDEDVKEMISIYYDKRRLGETRLRFEECIWLDGDDFLRLTNSRNADNSNVVTVTDTSGVQLLIFNDKPPTYYTSFDDTTLIFDSYDTAVDDTLQANKTQARAYVMLGLDITDETIPDLPSEAFSALIEEAKSKAMFKLKQYEDKTSESEAARQTKYLSRKSWRINGGIRYPNYGRKRNQGLVRDPTFQKDRE